MNIRPSLAAAFSAMTTSKPIVNIDITSDLMCPWCWIGLRKLQAASKETGIGTNISWKPFLLRPNMPIEGTPKGGTPESRVGPQLRSAGKSVGIDFTGLTDRTPNTVLFHATMKMLQESPSISAELASAFQEAAFEAYFTLGIFPDEKGLLKAAGNMTVNDKEVVVTAISDLYQDETSLSRYAFAVKEEAFEESARGVSGVPFFSFNGVPAFSGAQSVSTFGSYLTRAALDDIDHD